MSDIFLKHGDINDVVRLDPDICGSKSEYAVFPKNSRGAVTLISMKENTRPGSFTDDILEILIANEGGDRVSSVDNLIERLKGMRCH